jgi:hypothetical protein
VSIIVLDGHILCKILPILFEVMTAAAGGVKNALFFRQQAAFHKC